MPRKVRSDSTYAYAVVRKGTVDLARIEPFTEEGHGDLVRSLNRPAGERVVVVAITIQNKD